MINILFPSNLILRNDKGEILGLKGVQNGSFAGFYDLPGGRIGVSEFSRSLEEVLRREVREEIGDVDFQLVSPRPVAVGRHIIPARFTSSKKIDVSVFYIFFEGVCSELPPLVISDEHDGYAWIDVQHVRLEDYFTSGILEGTRMYVGSK